MNLYTLDGSFNQEKTTNSSVNLKNLTNKLMQLKSEKVSVEHSEESSIEVLYNLKWKITTQHEEDANSEEVSIPDYLIEVTENSKGKFDLYLTAYLCMKLNKALRSEESAEKFYPWIMKEKNVFDESYLTNLAKKGEQHAKKVKDYQGFTTERLQVYKDNISLCNNSDKIWCDLRQLENEQLLVLLSGKFDDIERVYEYLCASIAYLDKKISKEACLIMNCFTMEQDWLKRDVCEAKVVQVGEDMKLEIMVEKNKFDNKDLLLLLSMPGVENDNHSNNTIQVKPDIKSFDVPLNSKGQQDSAYEILGKVTLISYNFGKAYKSGFMHWKVVKLEQKGLLVSVSTGLSAPYQNELKVTNDSLRNIIGTSKTEMSRDKNEEESSTRVKAKLLQGSFIVHPSGTRDMIPHEISLAFKYEKSCKSFLDVKSKLQDYKNYGINTLYITGIHERSDFHFSPRSRTSINTKLNGEDGTGLEQLVNEAHRLGIKIIADFSYKISSICPDKHYWDNILKGVNKGKVLPLYGAPGRDYNPDDSFLPNMRSYEAWKQFIDEMKEFVRKTNVDGLMLDCAEYLPLFFVPNWAELNRNDCNGVPHYTNEDRFKGIICKNKIFSPYDYQELQHHPNVFWHTVATQIKQEFPELILLGDSFSSANTTCQLGYKEYIMIVSGLIPRSHNYSKAFSPLFGKRLDQEGTITDCKKYHVNSVRRFVQDFYAKLPENSIMIQSTCNFSTPMPALLYGKGAWPMIDLAYFLIDIPMTFLNEHHGNCFRKKGLKYFTFNNKVFYYYGQQGTMIGGQSNRALKRHLSKIENDFFSNENFGDLSSINFQNQRASICPSALEKTDDDTTTEEGKTTKKIEQTFPLEKNDNTLGLAHGNLAKIGNDSFFKKSSKFGGKIIVDDIDMSDQDSYDNDSQDDEGDISKDLLEFNMEETFSHSKNASEAKTTKAAKLRQKEITREFDPKHGFDLNKISNHYKHRLGIRASSEVFRKGRLVPVTAAHVDGTHPSVLSFTRIYGNDIGMVTINTNLHHVWVDLDVKSLKFEFLKDGISEDDIKKDRYIVEVKDLMADKDYGVYTVYEYLHIKHELYLETCGTSLLLAKIKPATDENIALVEQSSIKRLREAISRNKMFYANYIIQNLVNTVLDHNSLKMFALVLIDLNEKYLKKNNLDIMKIFNLSYHFQKDKEFCGKFFAFLKLVKDQPETYNLKVSGLLGVPAVDKIDHNYEDSFNIAKRIAEGILNSNKMGPIVFVTPEYGNYSKVGGIAVMVNDLCKVLASFGEEVIVVTPYYNTNRKGETDYLIREGVNYLRNVEIYLKGRHEFGVHEIKEHGVQIYFMHNPHIYPQIYPDLGPQHMMTHLACTGKSTLQLLCDQGINPSFVVTNDWPAGLVAAYHKTHQFGSYFNNTKFFHVLHNADSHHEGRVYPSDKDSKDSLDYLYQLPSYHLVNPYWAEFMLNPTRCALINSDQWGTVSLSYKQEIQESSSLKDILNSFKEPFAFPNGIPKMEKLKRFKAVCGHDHQKAKEIIQKKYFNYSVINDDVCLYGFVGRITKQKGILMVLDIVEKFMHAYKFKCQFLIAGPIDPRDPYGQACAGKMKYLSNKYPHNFWADPFLFFKDGELLTCACDFGMMPSAFEPGGIVQHEFFVANTPVLAFKTGGLKDSVFNYSKRTQKGNGFVFDDYNADALYMCFEQGWHLFQKKDHYHQLRKNAYDGAIDIRDQGISWNKEFYKLTNKVFHNFSKNFRFLLIRKQLMRK